MWFLKTHRTCHGKGLSSLSDATLLVTPKGRLLSQNTIYPTAHRLSRGKALASAPIKKVFGRSATCRLDGPVPPQEELLSVCPGHLREKRLGWRAGGGRAGRELSRPSLTLHVLLRASLRCKLPIKQSSLTGDSRRWKGTPGPHRAAAAGGAAARA